MKMKDIKISNHPDITTKITDKWLSQYQYFS